MAENEYRSVLPQIIVAVVVALLVGTTSPWWWNEIFRKEKTNAPDSTHGTTSTNPPKGQQATRGGAIVVTASANPAVISAGQRTAVNVYVQDSQGQPLASAIVTLSSGGGRFERSGTTTVSGSTDSSGTFQAYWSCDDCAPAYTNGVRVTKSDYEEANGQWRVEIR